jgi:hypothetical protein
MEQHPVQPAGDRAARRSAAMWLALATVLGVVVVTWLDAGVLQRWLADDPSPPVRVYILLGVLGVSIAAPHAGLGVYLWRLADRVRDSGRWPPPGMALLRATRTRTGEAADVMSRRLRALALGTFAIAAATTVVLLRVARLFEEMA